MELRIKASPNRLEIRRMEGIQRLTHRLSPLPFTGGEFLKKAFTKTPPWPRAKPVGYCQNAQKYSFRFAFGSNSTLLCNRGDNRSSFVIARAGWFQSLGEKKQMLPEIVKAGDPVLHEPAQEVSSEEIGSDQIQKIIEDMIQVMRKAPGVGLAAPQIGIPLKVSSNLRAFFLPN